MWSWNFKRWNRNRKLSVHYSNHLPWTYAFLSLFTQFFRDHNFNPYSSSWKFLIFFCFTSEISEHPWVKLTPSYSMVYGYVEYTIYGYS